MPRNPDIIHLTEYIKNILYFATVKQGKQLKSTPDTHYFSIDDELVYENYYSDFGPLNLGCVYKYCKQLNEKLKDCLNKQIIVHYTSADPKKKANAAFLLGSYGILYLSLSAKDALKPLVSNNQSFKPFQDATQGDSIYTITMLDCLLAIKKARELGFFNFQDFNYEEYVKLDQIQGGDLNWIIPGKFLAFIGPVDYNVSLYHPPEMYIDYFVENDVKIVIRLNKKLYDGAVFGKAGIAHYDLFFQDGSCPPRHILKSFLQISENSNGAIAVHCKAGLGRTGSLIGCYLIKHYRMTAHEAIGWMRICRPGSVIGHQQGWLEQMEAWLQKQGNLYRKRIYQDMEKLPYHEFGVYSIAQKSTQRRSRIYDKSPSPSPPMQRPTLADLTHPPQLRPKASRVRQAMYKTTSKEQQDWRLKDPAKSDFGQSVQLSKGASTGVGPDLLKKSKTILSSAIGAGEPRAGRSPSRSRVGSAKLQNPQPQSNILTKPSGDKNFTGFRPMTSLYNPNPVTVINNVTDAKNFLMWSSTMGKEKIKNLSSTITIKAHQPPTTPSYENKAKSNVAQVTPLSYSAATRTPGPQLRRRLGRSPSPVQSRPLHVLEHSKATNTPPGSGLLSTKNCLKTTIKPEVSTMRKGREPGSGGGGSVGAASLGARRTAPAPLRAPSVRSDERPLATQGDILNSIKFQRRYRASLHNNTGTFNPPIKENLCTPLVMRESAGRGGGITSKTMVKLKPSSTQDSTGSQKDKNSNASSRGTAGSRPGSPHGRRNLTFY